MKRMGFAFMLATPLMAYDPQFDDYPSMLNAARRGDVAEINKLLDGGVDVNRGNFYLTPLIEAAGAGYVKAVRVLLDRGASINQRTDGGNTALIAASRNGRREVVKLLLDRGAKTNIRDGSGKSPLMLAKAMRDRSIWKKQYNEIIKLLEEAEKKQ